VGWGRGGVWVGGIFGGEVGKGRRTLSLRRNTALLCGGWFQHQADEVKLGERREKVNRPHRVKPKQKKKKKKKKKKRGGTKKKKWTKQERGKRGKRERTWEQKRKQIPVFQLKGKKDKTHFNKCGFAREAYLGFDAGVSTGGEGGGDSRTIRRHERE